ncbi:MAG: TraR/DksA C4-type zinc finger protein [Pseudomonadota bacterium]
MLTLAEIDNFKGVLLREKAELTESDTASADDRSPVKLDQQAVGRLSRMDAMQQQAMANAASNRRAARITRIDAALRRMDEAEFGFCLDCGDDIGTARLFLDPTVPNCVSCAAG